MKQGLIIAFILSTKVFYTQTEDDTLQSVINPCAVFNKQNIKYKKPVSYPCLRESDAVWEKRVWRDIDLREKQNHKYYYPLEFNPCVQSFFQTVTYHLLKGNIVAFKDEHFFIPISKSEIKKMLIKKDSITQFAVNESGDEVEKKVLLVDSISLNRRILKLRLKEDWFFDKQRSEVNVRIIGMAVFEYVEEKEAYQELFWIYFPASRNILANSYAFNSRNDNEYRSFDELFHKRDFSSVIIKESNVYDRYIGEYANGIDALTEAEEIKTDLFNWEHDLWNY